MPTNANTFNSRVTSESLEAKFRQVFPAQGGAELVQDLYASGVIQPVIDFSSVAEGSVLAENLQTALDLGVSSATTSNATTTIVNNTGFWRVDYQVSIRSAVGVVLTSHIDIVGASTKRLRQWTTANPGSNPLDTDIFEGSMVVFVKTGESITVTSPDIEHDIHTACRQIADVNGNLVDPLGFTFT